MYILTSLEGPLAPPYIGFIVCELCCKVRVPTLCFVVLAFEVYTLYVFIDVALKSTAANPLGYIEPLLFVFT